MDPELSSNREKRRTENQEHIKHLLEDIWDYDLDETLNKIFSTQASKGIQCITYIPKEELMNIKRKEDNGDCSELMTFEVGIIRRLKN